MIIRPKRILVVQEYYLPGTRAGGPVRSLSNLISAMEDEFEFWLLTRDRDHDDSAPYPGVTVDSWNDVGRTRIYYAGPGSQGLRALTLIIRSANPDVLYLNNLFSPLVTKVLVLRRLGRLRAVPTILAPRGALSPGAFAIRRTKKAAFLKITRLAGLYRNVTMQAASELEVGEIERDLPHHLVHHVPNVTLQQHAPASPVLPVVKEPGNVRLIFLSRLSPKKNLAWLLRLLEKVHGGVVLDLYGTLEDKRYWAECQKVIARLPPTVDVRHCGLLRSDDVLDTLATYHFFVLPTLGENFGHAIFEAFVAGCPAVISDGTPWRDLSTTGAGWDMALDDESLWLQTLQRCIDMGGSEHARMVAAAKSFAHTELSRVNAQETTRSMFLTAAGGA